ncbi:MAG: alginate export family protein [Gammaproteobacteria bacterium]
MGMLRRKFSSLLWVFSVFTSSVFSIYAQAVEARAPRWPTVGWPIVDTRVLMNAFVLHDADRDLGAAEGGEFGGMGILIKPRWMARFNEQWRGELYAQAFYASDTVFLDADEGGHRGHSSDHFLGLRELWLDWSGLSRYPGESIRFGRERVKYHDGWWFDTDIEVARWILDTSLLSATFGVAEKVNDFRTGDSALDADEENLRRLFGHWRRQYAPHHYVELRALHTAARGLAVGDPRLRWIYVGVDNGYFDYRNTPVFSYVLGLQNVRGDAAKNVSNQDASQGVQRESVMGWAFDVGWRWRPSVNAPLAIGAHYAYAPGDEQGGFRQTGVHSNRANYTGVRSAMNRFNEALRVELFNLQVASLYMSYGVREGRGDSKWDVSAVYQHYTLDKPELGWMAQGVSDGVLANDDRTARTLGDGVDLMMSWYWNETAHMLPGWLRVRLSGFFMDAAVADARNLDATRTRAVLDWVVQW